MSEIAQAVDRLVSALGERLEREPDIAVAYLFGSVARGTAGPLSDVDVAVLLRPEADLFRRRLEIIGVVTEAVGSDRVDVVLLNEAPSALGYRVLRDGRLLLCRDEQARIDHRVATVNEYLDTEPMRRMLDEGLSHQLKEGRFGRL